MWSAGGLSSVPKNKKTDIFMEKLSSGRSYSAVRSELSVNEAILFIQ